MFWKKYFIPILLQLCFWMLLFNAFRILFLAYNIDELEDIPLADIFNAFLHALRIDLSMASYFLAFTTLCIFIAGVLTKGSNLIAKKIIGFIHSSYVVVLIVAYAIISIAELEIYDEWGTKMNLKALRFLQHPAEVWRSASLTFMLLGWAGVILVSGAFLWLYTRLAPLSYFYRVQSNNRLMEILRSIGFAGLMPGILLIGIRGGLQQIPIQQSDAYFSSYNLLNLAAVNSGWNLGQSIWENRKSMEGNPFQFYDLKEAQATIDSLYSAEKDTVISILKTNRPNIVMILLESWSADMVKSLGGYDSAAVHFDMLGKQGLMFDSIYASGSLSDQGMTAIYSAFPALPFSNSIIAQPDKYSSLPCINEEFHSVGYHSSFLFGGQLSYGNIKAYMYYNQFEKILEGEDFSDNIPRGKLGVHDEYLYERQLAELRKEKEPFFASMFTMSSHSPYDMPMKESEKVEWGGDENDYVNSVRYADKCLFEFIQKARKEKWFSNTLFIIMSDHSHRSPKDWSQYQPEYRRIPFMFWGPALKDSLRGERISRVGSQLDLAATLLPQLGLSSSRYYWSRNLLNPYTKRFAFYETHDGFGYVNDNQYIVYSHPSNTIYFEKTNSDVEKERLEKEGKSYLQVMFQQYTEF